MENACTRALVASSLFLGLLGLPSDTHAYDDWASGCDTCHGDFRDSPYVSLADGSNWGDDLHDVHRNDILDRDCATCHSGSGRSPTFLAMSAGGAGLPGISCAGCHGRQADEDSGAGYGAGLRQHHFNTGTTNCVICHADADPDNYTPVGEHVLPPYYTAAVPVTIPDDPCSPSGGEDFVGTIIGIDNDGDLDYDQDDTDCMVGQVCGDMMITPPEACELGEVDSCEHRGVFHADGTNATCAGDCLSYDTGACAFCGDGSVDAGFEACENDADCNVVNVAYYVGDLAICAGDCSSYDTAACRFCGDAACEGGEGEDAATCASDCPQTCGDGLVTGSENCELGDSDACENQGAFHADGTLADCVAGCLAYDVVVCASCGDGAIDAGFEMCDGDVDCSTVSGSYYSGDAAVCAGDCSGYDVVACRFCGDGVCDGGDGEDAITCAPDCGQVCGDMLLTGSEACELGDLDACENQGMFHADGSNAACASDCSSWDIAACAFCGDLNTDAGFEICDGDVDCSTVSGSYYAGDAAVCAGDCSGYDLAACRFCGDGACDGGDGEDAVTCSSDCAQTCGDSLLTGSETCELGNTDLCQNQGSFHANGVLASCAADCASWDASGCAFCGDGMIDGGFETCDGDVDCSGVSVAYYSGDLASCAGDCSGYDTGACRFCGDGVCDGGDGEDAANCSGDCAQTCGDMLVTGAEACEVGGTDLCENQGAFHADGSEASCAGDCLSYDTLGCAFCGDGTIDGGFETCDGDVDCNAVNGSFYAGYAASCAGDCSGYDTAACLFCGDGICDVDDGEDSSGCAVDCPASCGDVSITPPEICEIGDMDLCENQGAFHADGGVVSCAPNCLSWNTSGCAACGDGSVDAPFETCDGDVACDSVGAFYAGDLATCAGDCSGYDTGACRSCGDGTCDVGDGETPVSCVSDCADTCGDMLVTGSEVCELGNMDLCENHGTFHPNGSQVSCAADCSSWDASLCASCGDGSIDAGFENCDGDLDCSAVSGTFYTGNVAVCAGDCSGYDTSVCRYCGDGSCDVGDSEDAVNCAADCTQACGDMLVTGSEACELGDTDACENQGAFHADGTLTGCALDCLSFDTVPCASCGDGVIDAPFEVCDGDVDCDSLGMGYPGDLAACAGDCSGYDTSACRTCGDGNCDGGDGEDASTCAADCATTCGDGLVTGSEACELGDADVCENQGAFHADGALADCDVDCLGYDTGACASCGDGAIDAGFEICDGDADCDSIGMGYPGDLATCAGDCSSYDTSACRACGDGACDVADGEDASSCVADCATSCGDGLVTGSEVCEVADVDACENQGAFHADGAQASCAATCLSYDTSGCSSCGDGSLDLPFEICDGPADCSAVNALYYAGDLASCAGDCSGYDISACRTCGDGSCDGGDGETAVSCAADCATTCGDGIVTGSELCEVGQTDPCESQGAYHPDGASAVCNGDCRTYDTSACASCGDGALDLAFEVCESDADCAAIGAGYAGEAATCAADCASFDTSSCRSCGDGVVDVAEGEECDGSSVQCDALLAGGFTGGSATCALGCTLDLSACTHCGDGTCNGNEDASTCIVDCDGTCGDGFCSGSEDVSSCPSDCSVPRPDGGLPDTGAPDAGGTPSEVGGGGCGCHVAAQSSPASAMWVLLLGLAAFVRLRRRSLVRAR